MSSHHIVREDQEPALLIMDASVIPFERVQELLEWSPTVIVAEQALSEVLTWGIKIDVVIAHASQVPVLTSLLHDQFPLKIISFQESGDELSTTLYFLIASKQKAVNILATNPLEEFEKFPSLHISVFHPEHRWMLIRSGHYEKWLPSGRTVQTYPENEILKTQSEGVITFRKENAFWVSED